MASKFEGLEGVVSGQKEVFETVDETVPEGPVVEEGEDGAPAGKSKDLDERSINAEKAYDRFKGTELGVGLSGKGGYVAREQYEMAEGRRSETMEQRFNRLRMEFDEFSAQVEAAKNAVSGKDGTDGGASSTVMAMSDQVKFMHTQLQQINLDEALGKDAVALDDVPGMQSELTRRLVSEISKFKSQGGDGASAGGSDGQKSDVVTYELRYRPEHAKYMQGAKISAVEQRVHQLQKQVGDSSLAAIANFLDVPNLSLKSAVEALAMRVDSLSEENLADLDRRLQSVINRLDEAAKKKKAIGGAASGEAGELASKVASLHEICQKWDPISACVPEVVDRLHTLRSLHEQGAVFGKTLSHLETVQQQLRDDLATQTVTLNTVEESFKKNFSTIEANFAAIDKRMQALSAKLG